MPLNTVISDSNFVKGDAARHLAGKTVLVMPVPDEDSDMEKAVLEALLSKGDVLLYGPADHASDTIKSLLGIETTMPLEGEFILESSLPEDKILQGGDLSVLKHQALPSGGG